ncbi:membrane dipeptidase [Sphingosinicella soli]|uniref:Membrane dipeptidase n=1 Tax=Sphingosinicella soli TaxID=333708 RepID=A0A7W7B2Q6_9SPHN|nr:membrane dipeptidase [Sphingosinicella soli]
MDTGRHAAGLAFLERYPTVDLHAHPGRFFMSGAPKTPFVASYPEPDAARAVAEMRSARLGAAVFATVADLPVLERTDRGIGATRAFGPGEALADHQRQIGAANRVFQREQLPLARTGEDIAAAHAEGRLAGLLSIEGGDFIEDRLDRIAHAAASGVRSITIIHYRTNQIGDTQTEAPTHGGLTALGRDTIRAMEAAGLLVDLSHASPRTVADATAIAARPMLLSHSNVAPAGGSHPRLVTLEDALRVTATGGVVGCVPAGFAQASFDDFVDTIFRMIDQLGIDHVAIGTDMDFTYRSVLPSYRDWPTLARALLARGLEETEAARVMGGNVMRILA